MKFLIIAITIFTTAVADVSHLDGYNYNEPKQEQHQHEEIVAHVEVPAEEPQPEYLPPVEITAFVEPESEPEEIKSEPIEEYLPPQAEQESAAPIDNVAAVHEDAVVISEAVEEEPIQQNEEQEPEPAHTLGENGYEYRTVKRFKYRYRV